LTIQRKWTSIILSLSRWRRRKELNREGVAYLPIPISSVSSDGNNIFACNDEEEEEEY
jgi:hypothetical protein